MKFRLGLFDNPYVDEDLATEIVGRQDFRDEGYAAQAASVTVLRNGGERHEPVLPLRAGLRVYAENVSADAVARLGTRVERPEDADVALVRLMAPFEPRSDLFLESWFHQGSLDFPPGLVTRLARVRGPLPAGGGCRPRPAGGADAAAAGGSGARGQLRHVRRRPGGRPDGQGHAARTAAVRPAALDGTGAEARRGRPGL